MGIIILLFYIIISLIVTWTISNKSIRNKINSILGFVLIFTLCGFVTYTPDWSGYEIIIENNIEREFFFSIVTNFFTANGLGYKEVHLFYIGCYSFLFIFLINKFKLNGLIIPTMYIALIYLFYTTQIRYFMGYFSIYLSFYYYFVEKAKVKSIILFCFGIINHTSLVLLLPFIYFFKTNLNKFNKKIIITSIILLILAPVIKNITSIIFINGSRFNEYLSNNFLSSMLGGIYSYFPYIVTYYLINRYVNYKLKYNPNLLENPNVNFLYRCSNIPYIYIGLSLFIQIIGQRFIIPSILFQIMLMLYLSNFNNKNQNVRLYLYLILCFTIYLVHIYILPLHVFGSNLIYDITLKVLYSNSIIKYLM